MFDINNEMSFALLSLASALAANSVQAALFVARPIPAVSQILDI